MVLDLLFQVAEKNNLKVFQVNQIKSVVEF